jgi:transcription termination factor Rho
MSKDTMKRNNLAVFLFVLMRDELVPGKVADIIRAIENIKGDVVELNFDGPGTHLLYEMAQIYVDRLLKTK